MVSLSFSSKYCQLIHINRPHCCKFLLNEHQPPCLSFPSSLIYFLLMPQSALPSQSSFPCACDARIWLHHFHTFSTVPVLADLPPLSLPITQFGSSTSPGKLFVSASHPHTETMTETLGMARTVPELQGS